MRILVRLAMLQLFLSANIKSMAQDNHFVMWNADGTSELVNVPYEKDQTGDIITNVINVGDAAAVDLSTIAGIMKTTTLGEWIVRTLTYTFKASTNPNCLYFVDADTEISTEMANSLQGLNVVKGTIAEGIELKDGFPFYTPRDFTANNICYKRLFGKGNQRGVGGGWQTVVLPFEVETVSVDSKELNWFANSNDDADFWVFKYVCDDGDHAVFDYNSESKLAAATPYIVAVPDDSWAGNDCSLEGKTLAFNAENAVVSKEVPTVVSSDNLRFVGTYAGGRNLSNAYVLNGEGTYFTPNSSINPFNAYVQKKDGTAASARINISFADDAVASVDGISTSFDCNPVHTVFDLSGRMLSTQVGKVPSTLPKGIYIVNGKKVVVR